MKDKKKRLLFLVFLLCSLCLLGTTASAGFRRTSNGRYRYYTSKTKYLKGNALAKDYRQWTFRTIGSKKRYTYCFDSNGYMLTGWQKLYVKKYKGTEVWCYFDRNGRMFKNRTKNGHYLGRDGVMLVNKMGPNGIYYGPDGVQILNNKKTPGFKKTKKGIKFLQADGTYATKTWKCVKDKIDNKYYWYYFYSSGYMAKKTWVGDHYVDSNGRWNVKKTK